MNETLDEMNGGSGLSSAAAANLKEGGKWAKIMAIIGFIFSGLYGLAGVLTLFGNVTMGFIALLFTAFFFYMFILLKNQANAITNSASLNLDAFALNFMRYWKIWTIVTLVYIILSILLGIFARAIIIQALQSMTAM